MVQILGLWASLLRKLRGERYFLVPNKKVTKEVGLGEMLTVTAYRYCIDFATYYPGFKPLSPKTPSRPLSLVGWWSILADGSWITAARPRKGKLYGKNYI